ncbi:queuosine salvage protein-like isoform X2 [Nylanderia fulva]|uniref:queuosine salvage protein-like isoform X2 n=1 Tax=Nylanderia fulva TaxID=613905 RepID=UPI0010FB6613|nr:queuosine salvage protein-like isoform X2 [Nylanderia fulva]
MLLREKKHSSVTKVKNYILQNYQTENLAEITNLTRITSDFYPDLLDHRAVDWIFVLNTLNFALWNPRSTKQWTVNQLTGYQALCVAIKRAIDEEIPIWSPKYYTKLTQHELEMIFKSDDGETNIPLIHERLTILHEIGNILLHKYQGSFVTCVKRSKGNPLKLLNLIVTNFESYQDKSTYEKEPVYFYTKARSLVSDIWFYFKGHKFGFNYATWMKTMFIDYRFSQILLHFKIVSYSKQHLTKLERNDELKYGSKEEIEIRSSSMAAIDSLSTEVFKMCNDYFVKKKQTDINYTIILDNFLSDYRQVHDQLLMETQPFPNIKCVYY